MHRSRSRAVLTVGALGVAAVACEATPSGESAKSTAERITTSSTVPGRVEAESYALGGEGTAYHVAHGDYGSDQPRADSMDLGADSFASGGYAIGWIDAGQWFAYDVDVSTPGSYTISPRVSAPWQPGALHVDVDDVTVADFDFGTSSGYVSLPESPEFELSAGAHRLSVGFDAHGFNFDALDVNLKQAAQSPYVPAGYDLVFSDEFNGTQLDTSKWWTRFPSGDGLNDNINDEPEVYRENNNHVMTGSTLALTAKKDYPSADPTGGKAYSSGLIRSKQLFRYGYFEARVKMPKGLGAWPAFWILSEAGDPHNPYWPPEIDIFEFANNGTDDTPYMLHVDAHGIGLGPFTYADTNFNTDLSEWWAPFDFTADFHVIAELWEDTDQVTTFVDGVKLMTRSFQWVADDGTDAEFGGLILNYALGTPNWAGRNGIDDSVFPQGFEIDYVRAYQKTNDHRLAPSTIGVDKCPPGGGC